MTILPNVCNCGSHPDYSGKHIYPCHRGSPYETAWADGSESSSGTAGARGPSMLDSEIAGRLRTDASSTPGTGLNTFQGHLQDISLRLSAERGEGYILTVYFDYQTALRLNENLCGNLGRSDMVGAGSSVTITTEAPLIT